MRKILAALLLFPLSLFGTVATWDLTGSGNWNVNGNWNPTTFPNAIDDTANFFNSITANSVITLGQNISIGTLQFDSTFNYNISGANTLTFQTSTGNAAINVTSVNGTGAPTISATPIQLNSPLDVTNSSTSSLTISGAFGGLQALNKLGTGTLVLSGTSANSLGTVTINAGAVNLNKTSGISAINGPVVVNSGGTLALLNSNQISTSSLMTLSGGTLNLGGFSTNGNRLTFTSGTYTSGGGTLTLSNSGTNALSMDSGTVIDGPLSLSNATGGITFVGTTTQSAINSNVSFGSGTHSFTIARGTDTVDMDINGVISGIVSFNKLGSGILRFSGTTANTFSTGTLALSAGELHLNKTAGVVSLPISTTITGGASLVLDTANQIADTATITLSNGTFNMNGNAETIGTFNYNGGTFTQGGGLLTVSNLSMRNTTINGNISASLVTFDSTNNGTATINGNVTMTSNPTFSIANGTATTDMTVNGAITGSGYTKSGAGRLELTGTTANTVGATVTAGELVLNKTPGINAISSGGLSISGGTVILNAANQIADSATVTLTSGTFNMNGFSEAIGPFSISNGTTLTQGGGVLTINGLLTIESVTISGDLVMGTGGAITVPGGMTGTAIISGNLDLGGNVNTFTINNGTAATDMNISGAISNGGISFSSGGGQLEFSGTTANTYSGLTTLSSGTLTLNKTAGVNAIGGSVTISGGTLVLANANQIADTSAMTLTSGTFNMGGFAETLGSLTYRGGTFSQGGATLTLAGAGTALSMRNTTISGNLAITGGGAVVFDAAANGTATISGNLDMGGSTLTYTINNGTATTDMSITGIISNGGVSKAGAGRLDFTGTSANTYTGTTTVSAGELFLNKTGVNAVGGNVTLSGGTLTLGSANQIADTSIMTISSGTFAMAGFSETISALNFNGGTLTQGAGTLTLTDSGTALSMRNTTISGALSLTGGGSIAFDSTSNGTATISGNTNLGGNVTSFNIADGTATTDMTVSGVISNGGVTKIGAGRLDLTGASSNTYTGLTTVSVGTLGLGKTSGINAVGSNVLINGGTLLLTVSNQIPNTSTVTLSSGTFNMGGLAETIGTLIFNAGTLTQGAGTLTLADSVNALTMRDTTISGALTISGGGSIVFDNTNNGTATISGNINMSGSTITYNIADGTATTDMTASGVISNGAVTKTGAGRLDFTGSSANTYTGVTTVSGGELVLNKSAVNAIAGNITINGGTLTLGAANQIINTSAMTLSSGTFSMAGFSDTIASLTFTGGTLSQGLGVLSLANATTALTMRNTTVPGDIIITGGGAVVFDNTNNGTATISGNINMSGSTITYNIANGSAATDMSVSGVISNGAVTKTGAGLLEFTGSSANTYTGLTTVSAGTLQLNKTAGINAIAGNVTVSGGALTLGASNQIADTATLTVSSGSFNMDAFSETLNTFTFNGGTMTQGVGILTLTNGTTALTMRNTTVPGDLAITGGGAIVFDSTSNGTATLAGSTNLGGSTINFNIANGTASTDMNVSGVLSNGAVTKIGAGRLEFSGASANTYTGLTTVSVGELLLNKTSGVNAISGNSTISGGTLTLGASNQISDTSVMTLSSGTFDMAGFSDTIDSLTFTGGTLTQGAGVLGLANGTNALTMRNTTIPGAIAITGGGSVVFDSTNNGTATLAGSVDLGGSTINFDIANGTASTDMNVSGVISNGGISKTGAGLLEFSGTSPNTYTGLTTVTAGDLLLNKSSGVNSIVGDLDINGGTVTQGASDQFSDSSTVTLNSGTFNLGGFSAPMGTLIFNGGTFNQGATVLMLEDSVVALSMKNTTINGDMVIVNGGAIEFDSSNNGTATINGNIDLGGNFVNFDIQNGLAATDMLVSGVISDGGVTKTGAGLLEFSGTSPNTYTGLTTVTAGELLLNKTSGINAVGGDVLINGGTLTLGAADEIPDTSTVTLSSGTFDMGGFSETIGTFVFNGGTFLLGGPALTLANSGTALSMQDTILTVDIDIIGGGSVVFDSTDNGTAIISGNTDLGGSTINFNIADGSAATDMNVSGVISNGSVTKTGAGLLEFSGISANTYTGLTTVSAGELLLNKTGVNAIIGDVIINGGTLSLGAANQISNTSTLSISSGLFDMNGFSETIDSLTFNGGALVQGAGVLSLASGTTALTMRATTIAGSLAITGGGDIVFDSTTNGTAVISGNTNLSGFNVEFDIGNGTNATDMLVSGTISNGALTKEGAGTLELTGANTYSGGTFINAGTVLGNTTSLQGNIADNANLVFDQQSDGTFAGSLSGAGNLFKIGPAELVLSTANTVGNTTVSDGSLVVNGSLGGGGSLIVDAGTLLAGVGTITKDAVISGTLAPGNSIGTIHLIGNQTLTSGSTLEIELNPTTSDLVDIIGTLTIQPNATLMLIPEAGSYPSTFTYIIVHTSAGVTGTFTTVTSTLPLFSGTVEYDGFNVLVVHGEFSPFSSLINTGNAGVVARTIDALATTPCDNLTSIIDSLRMFTSVPSLENAFLQMQPSAFTALEVAQENDTLHIQDTVNGHLEQLFSCAVQEFEESSFWLNGLGSKITQETHGQEPGFSASSPGVFFGYDHFVDPVTCIGGGLGYTHTNLNWQLNRGNAEIDTAYCALYGRMDLPSFYIAATLMGGINFYEISRPIVVPDVVNVTAQSDHHGVQGSANIKSGLLWGWQKVNISPYFSLDYIALQQEAFNEHGAQSLNLRLSTQNSSLLVSELGLDITSCFEYYSPFLSVGVMRENRLSGEHIRSTMQCGTAEMVVTGYCPSRTLGKVLVGLNAQIDRSELNVSYEGKFASAYSDHALSVEFVFHF